MDRRMPDRRGLVAGSVTAAIAGAVLVAGCVGVLAAQQPPPRTTRDTAREMMVRPECGGHETQTIPLSGLITNIPEFHDCQRFIHDGGYIARFAVFVAYNLDVIVRSLTPDTATACMRVPWVPTRGADSSWNDPAVAARMARTRAEALVRAGCRVVATTGYVLVPVMGAAITTIYNFGTVPYRPLGIDPGFNCLYLARDPWTGRWRAKMVPNGQVNPDCPRQVPDLDAVRGKDLEVRESGPAGFGLNDYPPAARWDWDPVAFEQYVGIKCLAAWCEIGAPGFTSSPAHAVSTNTIATTAATTTMWPPWEPVSASAPTFKDARRVAEIKGWYDEERLAAPSPDSALHPASVWGVIFPHPGLGALTSSSFLRTWQHVADAVLEGTTPPYGTTKLNLGEGTNLIYLCSGEVQTDCGIDTTWTDPRRNPPTGRQLCDPSTDGRRWWAKIVDPLGRTEFRCVYRRDHGRIVMPAAARWRWKETDQTVWIRCDDGCCDLQ